ncbi:TPA: VRR-NUC domain-containing protein [Klebsiella aerogenes]|nr:VRR-NUC domain-containing protein [Klebsiella aerogenes]
MVYIREVAVEKPLVKAVERRGGLCLKFTSPGRRAVPDRLVLLPGGVVFFVECKAPGQKPTAAQLREHARLRGLGFRVEVHDNPDPSGLFATPAPLYKYKDPIL